MRGEYPDRKVSVPMVWELPPRARRIPVADDALVPAKGTTSACAENTPETLVVACRSWNYLRVRGEYKIILKLAVNPLELPPRARRIQHRARFSNAFLGTTSACAENTTDRFSQLIHPRNYLRVRGEYCSCCLSAGMVTELPPRARRIPPSTTRTWTAGRNYLRVRGEYGIGGAPGGSG